MSLAIVDAVAEPGGEPDSGPTSRYLTSIANMPLISHVFDELAKGGVERALIIAHDDARAELEEVLGGGKPWGIEVSYSEAPETHGEQTVLMQISRALSSGPVLVYPADCLFPGQISSMRDRFSRGDVDCVLLGLSPDSGSPESRLFTTAVMLGSRTQKALGDSISHGRDSRGLQQVLLARGCRVAVCEATQQWSYGDSTERLLAANRMLLDDLTVPSVEGTCAENNEIHGRVAIGPRARVVNSSLFGPAVIDEDAVVEDSFVGPYTAIGRGARISGSELDNTMVLPFAELRHPGFRIEGSIIGERASLSRSFELPKGLHLRLMPGSHVTLS